MQLLLLCLATGLLIHYAISTNRRLTALEKKLGRLADPSVPPPIPKQHPPSEPMRADTPPPTASSKSPSAAPSPRPPIQWEEFLGAKLFAWIGGLALFLGVAFFIKYSLERNLIPDQVRATVSAFTGIALIAGAQLMRKRQLPVTAQVLSATGIVVLYAVAFACRAVYRFEFFTATLTLGVMVLITAGAIFLSLQLNARVVAVLGILAGFLTPVLLSSGKDEFAGFCLYLAALDAGLLIVGLRKRWDFLIPLAAAGTLLLQATWFLKHFEPSKLVAAAGMLAGFSLLFGAGAVAERFWRPGSLLPSRSAAVFSAVTLFVGLLLISDREVGLHPVPLMLALLVADLVLLGATFLRRQNAWVFSVGGAILLVFLWAWSGLYLQPQLLLTGLISVAVFALIHALVPLVVPELRDKSIAAVAPVALPLLAWPMVRFPQCGLLLWPFLFLTAGILLAGALLRGSIIGFLSVLIACVGMIGLWLGVSPADAGLEALAVTALLCIFFLGACWRAKERLPKSGWLAAGAALLPFTLLVGIAHKMPMADPSLLFATTLLLGVGLFIVVLFFDVPAAGVVGLAGTVLVQQAWQHSWTGSPSMALGWSLIFYAIFLLFPFLFFRRLGNRVSPWAASALAGPAHFYLLFQSVGQLFPGTRLGWLPAALALPTGLALWQVHRAIASDSPARTGVLSWFGGATLFFVTLVFPIQFEREWITLGLAFEGMALLWLFQKLQHPGLRWTGLALLVTTFVRLALNPAILDYHPRSGVPLFNWYFYSFGLGAAALFIGALLERGRIRGLLSALGTILLFLLMNLEIADYFSKGSVALVFQFSGNLARDMSYSIGWALFALVLLVIGVARDVAPVRYAGASLLAMTLLKLFFHDLSRLDQLYRVGALVGVAAVAILASVLYQRAKIAQCD